LKPLKTWQKNNTIKHEKEYFPTNEPMPDLPTYFFWICAGKDGSR